MKILMLATGFPPAIGGADRFAVNLARGLGRAGCGVRVLTTIGAGTRDGVTDLDVTRTPAILNRPLLKLAPLTAAAIRLCRRERPDRVVAMVWTYEGLTALLLSVLFGIEYAVVAHGSEILQYRHRPLYRLAMRLVLLRASIVVANSRFTSALVESCGVASERVVVVNPPIDVSGVGTDLGAVEERFNLTGRLVLFTAARLVPRKGHAYVIEALARLKARHPSLVYVMTGTGDYRHELETLATRLGVADRVILAGCVSDEDLLSLYRRADLYVAPSIEIDGDVEGFGMSLAEAGACGVPVIAGRSGGVDDVITDGDTGVLVTPGDLDGLTQAIHSLLDDRAGRRALGARGRAHALGELGVDRQASRFYGYLLQHEC